MSNVSIGAEEINHRLGFHKATIEGENATAPVHQEIRRRMIEVGNWLDELLPPGRAKNVAFTKLEDAAMWAHKALAQTDPLVNE